MRDVRPLGLRRAPPAVAPPVAEPAVPTAGPSLLVKPSPAPRRAGPVDRGTLDRLKRGQITIEGRIDLHGMDQRAAFAALMGFVDHSARAGRRALLVITGKGSAGEGGGVLKRNVPAWLRASPLAGRILAIAPAHRMHGGDGAVYVLLRRRRSE